MNCSLFNPLNQLFGWIMKAFNNLTGNYLFAVILFAILAKILLFPLGIKQQKTSRRQAELQPKEQAIRKKYGNNPDRDQQQKMQQEVMELYQAEHYSPFSGCLPLLIQLPIILILYNVITSPLTYICGYSSNELGIVKKAIEALELGSTSSELSIFSILRDNFTEISSWIAEAGSEVLAEFKFEVAPALSNSFPNFTTFGIDLSAKPDFWNILLLVPLLTFITQFISMRLSRKLSYIKQTNEQKLSMWFMDISLPLFTTYLTFIFPSLLGIYWLFNNLLGMLQQYILKLMYPAPVFTEEDYRNAELALKGKTPKGAPKIDRTVPGKNYRSLHHIDDEEEYPDIPYSPDEENEKADKDVPNLKEDNPDHKK